MQKYILLDIDGVMVPASGWKPVELQADGFYKFNFLAQQNLEWLLQETGATIVLISTHRSNYTNSEWTRLFNNRFEHSKEIQTIDDFGPNSGHNRLEEVLQWTKEHSQNSQFVIIDDDNSLQQLPFQIKKHWVKTQSMIGLNRDSAVEALKILSA